MLFLWTQDNRFSGRTKLFWEGVIPISCAITSFYPLLLCRLSILHFFKFFCLLKEHKLYQFLFSRLDHKLINLAETFVFGLNAATDYAYACWTCCKVRASFWDPNCNVCKYRYHYVDVYSNLPRLFSYLITFKLFFSCYFFGLFLEPSNHDQRVHSDKMGYIYISSSLGWDPVFCLETGCVWNILEWIWGMPSVVWICEVVFSCE